ncbi:MAG: endopeptidase La [Candidatus Marinimicrobia bacterium]|jgi:ATP-dependent Lon protease|nr:endopeptidase La [Candidatus Neomarinimicrobiota bacterium]MBT3634396.1 endopeptidase La [Candidatus Neomarinimicrobiota bacterium]MBT3681695.1 endopeptidase La [Candidatus Neomarinimicrobiota bacterium]MBT3759421.1 endopeptidase La [Candidatus Neomarinimicrobiota bacterium]MBT3895909.1 endopeptidase La [Candidatus Neomarinimicrobiota bacterium]
MSDLVKTDDKIYPILPLRNTVLFPQQIIPIYIGRSQSLNLIADLPSSGKKMIIVVAQKDGSVETPTSDDLFEWGTLAIVMRVFNMPDKQKSAIVQGIGRVRITQFTESKPYFKGNIMRFDDPDDSSVELKALMTNLQVVYEKLVDVAPYLSNEQFKQVTSISHPGKYADRAISVMNIATEEKQKILENINIKDRLEKATVVIGRELQRIELSDKIQSNVQDEISKSQREYYLREQMKAIRKELGDDEPAVELIEIEEKVKKAKMPEPIEKVALKEMERLKRIPTQSPEYTVARTYIDWLVDLPWSVSSDDNEDIKSAHEVLDHDHYGLQKVKERILEHLAVRKLKRSRSKKGERLKSPILCFGGPPGTGKTSMGKSIARAMNRKFIRISLGGVRDEAEIRGHRRTYIGALPGRIIANLKKAGTNNPIFMLDEIDKLGMDFRGDPSSALLEVLDPEQNFAFNDHYLEVDFDLSNIIFITTANRVDKIPGPLRDRMEVLEFTGYIMDEKLNIAKNHLVDKQVKEHGLKKTELQFKDDGLTCLIESYTREAGVRNLERQIANICRKAAMDIATGKHKRIKIIPETVERYLGPIKFYPEVAERAEIPGIVVGLAWTAFGGDILFVEVSKMPGKGELKLTGQLGDVMKESVQAAYSYIRSNAEALGIDPKFHEKIDLHVHVPAGAIPKDGPSAGITMLTAITSLLLDIPVGEFIGMTGEISLRGNVLPIGGLKEKSTAAHRAGLKHIIVPKLNKKDLLDIPDKVKKDLKITFVSDVNEVLKLALGLEVNNENITEGK